MNPDEDVIEPELQAVAEFLHFEFKGDVHANSYPGRDYCPFCLVQAEKVMKVIEKARPRRTTRRKKVVRAPKTLVEVFAEEES